MGERDLGTKTSMMQNRAKDEPPPCATRPPDRDELDGTIAEVLPEEEIAAREDEDLAEAKAIDENDTPEDDYVQQGSDFNRGVIGAEPTPEDLKNAPREDTRKTREDTRKTTPRPAR